MSSRAKCWVLVAALMLPVALHAQQSFIEKIPLSVRGHAQEMYRVVATNTPATQIRGKILFAPGDGGWRGFAITMAEHMAAAGYEVYALDTKHYLESFTGKVPLTPDDVMKDFGDIARAIGASGSKPVALVGWSEGAGLCLLAAVPAQNKPLFNRLVLIAATDTNILGWRWSDYLSYITGRDPSEPTFLTAEYLSKAAPVPMTMIQSTGDHYVSVAGSQKLFAAAGKPKQFVLIEAQNHRFDGNHGELFDALATALRGMETQQR